MSVFFIFVTPRTEWALATQAQGNITLTLREAKNCVKRTVMPARSFPDLQSLGTQPLIRHSDLRNKVFLVPQLLMR
jgi:hypothetical protein